MSLNGGYVTVYLGGGRRNTKLDHEHRVVAARALGKALPPGAEVHHIDGNRKNNANTNLVICQDRSYHRLLHRRQWIKRAGGDPNKHFWCSCCKRPVDQKKFCIRKSGPYKGAPTTVCYTCVDRKKVARKRAVV